MSKRGVVSQDPYSQSGYAVVQRATGRKFFKRPVRYVPKGKSRKANVQMRNIAKQIFNRMTETKIARYNASDSLRYYADANWSTPNVFPVTPNALYLNIAQGSGQNNRVGNVIRPVKVSLKGVLRPLEYNATTNPGPCPHKVVLYLLQDKTNPDPLPTTLPEFYQAGATDIVPSGSIADEQYLENTDRWKIMMKKEWKLGFAASVGTGGSAGYQQFTNNDYHLSVTYDIDITKCVSTKFTYDDATNTPTSTKGYVYAVWMIYRLDGTQGVSPQRPIDNNCSLYMTYKDA